MQVEKRNKTLSGVSSKDSLYKSPVEKRMFLALKTLCDRIGEGKLWVNMPGIALNQLVGKNEIKHTFRGYRDLGAIGVDEEMVYKIELYFLMCSIDAVVADIETGVPVLVCEYHGTKAHGNWKWGTMRRDEFKEHVFVVKNIPFLVVNKFNFLEQMEIAEKIMRKYCKR